MPADTDVKVIVTNVTRLKAKYKADYSRIKAAIKELIDADKERNLKTILVDLSSDSDMSEYSGTALDEIDSQTARPNKTAIDKICGTLRPSYLMLLGADDVIPQQDLTNPMFGGQDDDDFTFSDLPYACDASYSQQIPDFIAPTRVVGRLPDVSGGTDAGYLVGLLQTAAGYTQRPSSDYDAFLGITAEAWRSSTNESLRAVFGTANDMKVSPADGPNWSNAEIKRLAHFINCHGSRADWRFLGQTGEEYPVAHDATIISGNLSEGTVLAAECCYGAELYDPSLVDNNMGMCNTYLADKAYAYFGSSTIAYGPADGNNQADLLCQYFLQRVRAGSSAGRACLEARIEYIRNAHTLAPVDLKTLAQFNLMGDPAVTPVVSDGGATRVLSLSRSARGLANSERAVETAARVLRRETLVEMAKAVSSAVYVAAKKVIAQASPNKKVQAMLKAVAEERGLEGGEIATFRVTAPDLPRGALTRARSLGMVGPKLVHTLLKRMPRSAAHPKVIDIRGIQVDEFEDTVTVREFVSR
jgi:hypothetical protein